MMQDVAISESAILMAVCKTPVCKQWSYCSLAQSHWYDYYMCIQCFNYRQRWGDLLPFWLRRTISPWEGAAGDPWECQRLYWIDWNLPLSLTKFSPDSEEGGGCHPSCPNPRCSTMYSHYMVLTQLSSINSLPVSRQKYLRLHRLHLPLFYSAARGWRSISALAWEYQRRMSPVWITAILGWTTCPAKCSTGNAH